MLMWELECKQCQAQFEKPVPRGPKEEQNIKCPKCGSKNIKNLSVCSLESPVGG